MFREMVPQEYQWFARYENGEILSEFDRSGRKIDFKLINKDRLISFGMATKDRQLFINNAFGSIHTGEKFITISYDDYQLTQACTDVINYKQCHAIHELGKESSAVVTDQFVFGYKNQVKFKDAEFFVKFLYIIDKERTKEYLQIRITANRDLDGKLRIDTSLGDVLTIPAPLKKGYAGEIMIEVK